MELTFNKIMNENNLHLNGDTEKVIDWDKILNPKIEGTLEYKKVKAQYWKGDPDDGEEDWLFGDITNIRNDAFCLEGRNLQEFTADFHDAVDEFYAEFDVQGKATSINPSTGRLCEQPIEFYANDPAILDHFYNHERKQTIQNVNFRIEDFINLHQTVYATTELAGAA
jgi:hypothetical protein